MEVSNSCESSIVHSRQGVSKYTPCFRILCILDLPGQGASFASYIFLGIFLAFLL